MVWRPYLRWFSFIQTFSFAFDLGHCEALWMMTPVGCHYSFVLPLSCDECPRIAFFFEDVGCALCLLCWLPLRVVLCLKVGLAWAFSWEAMYLLSSLLLSLGKPTIVWVVLSPGSLMHAHSLEVAHGESNEWMLCMLTLLRLLMGSPMSESYNNSLMESLILWRDFLSWELYDNSLLESLVLKGLFLLRAV